MSSLKLSPPVSARDMRIGTGFSAWHLSEDAFQGLIDPVLMVDHFHMTAPTFQPHPHAGISAVTYLFEDSVSPHVNYDSLGHHGPIHPGALHWLAAGRGAVHTEQPEGADPHVHALQIFVNLPAGQKADAPFVVHVEPHEVPEHRAEGLRLRVVLGQSQGLVAPATARLPQPFTLLDGFVAPGAQFRHELARGWGGLVYGVAGTLELNAAGRSQRLQAGQGLGLQLPAEAAEAAETLCFEAPADGPPLHVVLLCGPALREPLVKQGPFVMNTPEQMQQAIRDYQAGRFGALVLPPPAG